MLSLFFLLISFINSQCIIIESNGRYISPTGVDAPGCGTSQSFACNTILFTLSQNPSQLLFLNGTYDSTNVIIQNLDNISFCGPIGSDIAIITQATPTNFPLLTFNNVSTVTLINLIFQGSTVPDTGNIIIYESNLVYIDQIIIRDCHLITTSDINPSSAGFVFDSVQQVYISNSQLNDISHISSYEYKAYPRNFSNGFTFVNVQQITVDTISSLNSSAGNYGRGSVLMISNFPNYVSISNLEVSYGSGSPITLAIVNASDLHLVFDQLSFHDMSGVAIASGLEILLGWPAKNNTPHYPINNLTLSMTNILSDNVTTNWIPNPPSFWVNGDDIFLPFVYSSIGIHIGSTSFSNFNFTFSNIMISNSICTHLYCIAPMSMILQSSTIAFSPYSFTDSTILFEYLGFHNNALTPQYNGAWFRSGGLNIGLGLDNLQEQTGNSSIPGELTFNVTFLIQHTNFTNNIGINKGAANFACFGSYSYVNFSIWLDSFFQENQGSAVGGSEVFFMGNVSNSVIQIGDSDSLYNENELIFFPQSGVIQPFSSGSYVGFSTISQISQSQIFVSGSFMNHRTGDSAISSGILLGFWDQLQNNNILVENLVCINNGFDSISFPDVNVGCFHIHVHTISIGNTINITNSVVINNDGLEVGGIAIDFIEGSDNDLFFFSNLYIQSNTGSRGGLKLVLYPPLSIDESPKQTSQVHLFNCTFQGNVAQDHGGGLSIVGATVYHMVSVVSSLFDGNLAQSGPGGGINLEITSVRFLPAILAEPSISKSINFSIIIDDSNFKNNFAQSVGGAIQIRLPTFDSLDLEDLFAHPENQNHLIISNTIFSNNTVSQDGSDVFFNGGGGISFIGNTFYSCADTSSAYLSAQLDVFVHSDWDLKTCVETTDIDQIELLQAVSSSKAEMIYWSNTICPYGFEVDFVPQYDPLYSTCIPCPPSSYSLTPGELNLNYSKSSFKYDNVVPQCFDCPRGAQCPGGGSVKALPGFWGMKSSHCELTDDVESHETQDFFCFSVCPRGYCCPYNSDNCAFNYCAGNRKGILCGECNDDHFQSLRSTVCLPNSECTLIGQVFAWSVGFFFATLYVYVLLNSKQVISSEFKICSNWLQLLPFVVPAFFTDIQEVTKNNFHLGEFVSWSSDFSNIQIFSALPHYACFYPSMTPLDKIGFFLLGPVFSLILLAFYGLITIFADKAAYSSFHQTSPDDTQLETKPPNSTERSSSISSSSFFSRLALPASKRYAEVGNDTVEDNQISSVNNNFNLDESSNKALNDDNNLNYSYGNILDVNFTYAFTTLVNLSYTAIIFSGLEYIHCVPTPDGTKSVLFRAGSIECLQWWQYIIIAIFVIFIAPVPLYIYFLRVYLHKNPTKHRAAVLQVFETAYSPNTPYYESIQAARRFFIVLLSISVSDQALSAFLISSTVAFFLATSILVRPYHHRPKMQFVADLLSFDLLLLSTIQCFNGAWEVIGTSNIDLETDTITLFENLTIILTLIPLIIISMFFLKIIVLPYLIRLFKYFRVNSTFERISQPPLQESLIASDDGIEHDDDFDVGSHGLLIS